MPDEPQLDLEADRSPMDAYARLVSVVIPVLVVGFALAVNAGRSGKPTAGATALSLLGAAVVSYVLLRLNSRVLRERAAPTVVGTVIGLGVTGLLVVVAFFLFWVVLAPALGYVPN